MTGTTLIEWDNWPTQNLLHSVNVLIDAFRFHHLSDNRKISYSSWVRNTARHCSDYSCSECKNFSLYQNLKTIFLNWDLVLNDSDYGGKNQLPWLKLAIRTVAKKKRPLNQKLSNWENHNLNINAKRINHNLKFNKLTPATITWNKTPMCIT